MRASNAAYSGGCAVFASTSVAPIERAIMAYCSDIVNLQALMGNDRTAMPRARVVAARQAMQDIEAQLEKITDAMLASADDGTPQVFARRARQLETSLQDAEAALQEAERDLASVARKDINGADEAWRALAEGVEAQDVDARLKARQLVADTFERIVVYSRSMRPEEADKRDYKIDLVLVAKGGNARVLRIDRDGSFSAGDDTSADASAVPAAG